MKQFFSLQRKYILERVYHDDFKRKMFERLGILNPFDSKNQSLTFKHSMINNKNLNKNNFMESQHTRSLQTSEYIKLDND